MKSALDGQNGSQLQGTTYGDYVARTLADAGDINGDGYGDLQLPTDAVISSSAVFDGGAGTDLVFTPTGVLYEDFEEVVDTDDATDIFVRGDLTTEVIADPIIGNIPVVKGKDHFDRNLQLTSSALGQVTVTSSGYDATINGVAALASFDNIARVKVVPGSGTDNIRDSIFSREVTIESGLDSDKFRLLGENQFLKGLAEDFEQVVEA